MQRFVLALALTAVFALPLSSAAPVSAGGIPNLGCPQGTEGIYIQEIQFFIQQNGLPPGLARHASAADVNHDSIVCAKERGARGVTFTDNIPLCGCFNPIKDEDINES